MTLLVTGGSGVVGRSLIGHLVAGEQEVRALVRSPAAADTVQSLGATPVAGDLDDVAGLVAAMSGVDGVFHVAGVNEMCLVDPAPMYRANVDGTRNVLRAANAAGVTRLVHTSSAVVLGEQHGSVGDERTEHRGFYLSHYEYSKVLAEQVALAEAGAVEVVIVNPSSVQGPGRASGTGKLILDLINGDLPFMVDTSLSVVDIDDCANGHLLAWEHGRAGQRYVLSGFSMSTRSAVSLLERVVGRRLRVRFVPGVVVAAGAGVVEAGYRVLRRRPPFCREMITVLRQGHTYDGSLATRELGLEYRTAEETIQRMVEWFRTAGLLD